MKSPTKELFSKKKKHVVKSNEELIFYYTL